MDYLDNILHTVCTKHTLSCYIFSLYGWINPYRQWSKTFLCSKPLPHIGLPSGLPFDPHTTVISLQNHPERDVFVFPSGLNSLLKVYALNKIIVLPVLSWPLVAKQPCLPEGHSSKPLYRCIWVVHDSRRLKGTYVSIAKWVVLTRHTCCWLSCWLITRRPSHLTSYYVLQHLWRIFIGRDIRFSL